MKMVYSVYFSIYINSEMQQSPVANDSSHHDACQFEPVSLEGVNHLEIKIVGHRGCAVATISRTNVYMRVRNHDVRLLSN